MFYSYVPFICYPSIPVRSKRAIHQHTFSRLASTKFTDCMTCLTSQTFLFCFPHTNTFSPVFQCLGLHMFELVYVFICLFLCFQFITIFLSQCAPKWLSRAIHQHSFSRLASAQFPDCISFPKTIAILPVHLCLSLVLPLYVSFFCHLSLPSVLP